MASNGTLSCPYKLPPLDPERALAAYVANKPKSGAAQAESVSPKGTSQFQEILSRTSTPRPGVITQVTDDEGIEVGRQVESFLLSLIFKQAFNSRLSSGLFGNSYASQMYLDMFIDAAAEEASRTSHLGIAELVAMDINRASNGVKEECYEAEELR